MQLEIVLAQPRGFCAGVVRAIDIVDLALRKFGAPVYVLHEIVHNARVLQDLRHKGAVFVESLAEIPAGGRAIFSAHGVASRVVDEATKRGLKVIDATCPLVTKVHLQGQTYVDAGCDLLLIGHAGHPEVIGIQGSIDGTVHLVESVADAHSVQVGNPERVAYVTQTTLSIDDTRDIIAVLQQRFPLLRGPSIKDICYATQNRQLAVKALAAEVDLVLIVGAANSSNSIRLREVAEAAGRAARRIADATEIDAGWFRPGMRVGITAGASAPDVLIDEILERLRGLAEVSIRTMPGQEERIVFRLPAAVRDSRRQDGKFG